MSRTVYAWLVSGAHSEFIPKRDLPAKLRILGDVDGSSTEFHKGVAGRVFCVSATAKDTKSEAIGDDGTGRRAFNVGTAARVYGY